MDSDVRSRVRVRSLHAKVTGVVGLTSFSAFRRRRWRRPVKLRRQRMRSSSHLGRTERRAWSATELAAYRPDLIVLAFGTNEGFSPVLTPTAYEAGLRAQVCPAAAAGAGATCRSCCSARPTPPPRAAGLPGADCGDGWRVPQLCPTSASGSGGSRATFGLAFWDWSAAMGGRCSSLAWRRDGMMRGDHVHFTRSGGDRIGAMIDAELSRAAGTGSLTCCFPTLTFGPLLPRSVYSGAWLLEGSNEWRKIALLIASWIFYGWWDTRVRPAAHRQRYFSTGARRD